MFTTQFTHWLTETHYWCQGMRRVEVTGQNDKEVLFRDRWGVGRRRSWESVIELESLDWVPEDGYEIYLKAEQLERCFHTELTASELQELRVRIEYLWEKAETVKGDHWVMRAKRILLDCAIWMPNIQVSRETYNQLTVSRFAQ